MIYKKYAEHAKTICKTDMHKILHKIYNKICKICKSKHVKYYISIKYCNMSRMLQYICKIGKYVSQNIICRICTIHFADDCVHTGTMIMTSLAKWGVHICMSYFCSHILHILYCLVHVRCISHFPINFTYFA